MSTRRRPATLRGAQTRREKDAQFLDRVLGMRWFNEREKELVTALVRRYHDAVFSDVLEILNTSSPLAPVTLLDNHAYLLERAGGPDPASYSCLMVYQDAPEVLCALREAPLPVRRMAVAAVKFRRGAERLDLPDGHFAGFWDITPMGADALALAARHHARIPELLAVVAARPDMTIAAVDAVLADGVAATVADGAL